MIKQQKMDGQTLFGDKVKVSIPKMSFIMPHCTEKLGVHKTLVSTVDQN